MVIQKTSSVSKSSTGGSQQQHQHSLDTSTTVPMTTTTTTSATNSTKVSAPIRSSTDSTDNHDTIKQLLYTISLACRRPLYIEIDNVRKQFKLEQQLQRDTKSIEDSDPFYVWYKRTKQFSDQYCKYHVPVKPVPVPTGATATATTNSAVDDVITTTTNIDKYNNDTNVSSTSNSNSHNSSTKEPQVESSSEIHSKTNVDVVSSNDNSNSNSDNTDKNHESEMMNIDPIKHEQEQKVVVGLERSISITCTNDKTTTTTNTTAKKISSPPIVVVPAPTTTTTSKQQQQKRPTNTSKQQQQSQQQQQQQQQQEVSSKQQQQSQSQQQSLMIPTWTQLILDSCTYIPIMTTTEYSTLLHLSSILLLGYLLPHSTGNDYYLLQSIDPSTTSTSNNSIIQPTTRHNRQQQQRSTTGSSIADSNTNSNIHSNNYKSIHEYIINLSLEERLEKSIIPSLYQYNSNDNEYGSYYTNENIHSQSNDTTNTTTSSSSCNDDPNSNEYYNDWIDPFGYVDIGLDDFLQKSIRLLLSNNGRTYTTNEISVDLLHILAMIIHPQPTVALSSSSSNNNDNNKTQRLIQYCHIAKQFQIKYYHRILILKIIRDCLVLPILPSNNDNNENDENEVHEYDSIDEILPLYGNSNSTSDNIHAGGAVEHLLLSIKSFALSISLSTNDSILSQQALISISTQVSNFVYSLKYDWDTILQTMIDDTSTTTPTTTSTTGTNSTIEINKSDTNTSCSNSTHCSLHIQRGQLLAKFVIRTMFNGTSTKLNNTTSGSKFTSTNNNLQLFLSHARTSLSDAIEWQTDCWTIDDDEPEKQTTHSPLLLAGLLHASQSLLYFYRHSSSSSSNNNNKSNSDQDNINNNTYDSILYCSIQLLRHPTKEIVQCASKFVLVALSYAICNVQKYEYLLLETFKQILRDMVTTITTEAVAIEGDADDKNGKTDTLRNEKVIDDGSKKALDIDSNDVEVMIDTTTPLNIDTDVMNDTVNPDNQDIDTKIDTPNPNNDVDMTDDTTEEKGDSNEKIDNSTPDETNLNKKNNIPNNDNNNKVCSHEQTRKGDMSMTMVGNENDSIFVDLGYERLLAVLCDQSPAFANALFKSSLNALTRVDDEDVAAATPTLHTVSLAIDDKDNTGIDTNDSRKELDKDQQMNQITNPGSIQKKFDSRNLVVFRCLSVICTNYPLVVSAKNVHLLHTLIEIAENQSLNAIDNTTTRDTIYKSITHVLACLLSSRLTKCFVPKIDCPIVTVISKFTQDVGKPAVYHSFWKLYQLANHALVTGNFICAEQLYNCIISNALFLSEQSYLWMSILCNVASAEALLSTTGVLAIPTASSKLYKALSYLQSLQSGQFSRYESTTTKQSEGSYLFTFHIRFILLRLDFLDLLTVIRQLTREMRLTATGPAKYTRSYLHLTNSIRGLHLLSNRYDRLIQQHGIQFRYPWNSIHSLSLLRDQTLFVAKSSREVFADILPNSNDNSNNNSSSQRSSNTDTNNNKNNSNKRKKNTATSATASVEGKKETTSKIPSTYESSKHPLASLMKRLDELVIQPMDASSLNPLIRSSAMLELIDGILMAPTPIPRDFIIPKRTWYATLHICNDPEQQQQQKQQNLNSKTPRPLSIANSTIIEACPMICFTFNVYGSIPKQLLENSQISPVGVVIIWHRFVYCGPLSDDDIPAANDNDNVDDQEKQSVVGSTDFSPNNVPGSTGSAAAATTSTSESFLVSANTTTIPVIQADSPKCTRVTESGYYYTSILCPPSNVEGWFRLEIRLGLRDATGNEWQIPVTNTNDNNPSSALIRVSRNTK